MGLFRPDLTNVILEGCCKDTLNFISEKLELNKLVQRIMIPAVFVSLFVSPSGRGAALSTIISIKQTDWAGLASATRDINTMTKYVVKRAAFAEETKHSGQLGDFWKGIGDVF